MAEYNSHKTYPNLNEQQFKLSKINEIKYYFVAEIKERELMSKRPGSIYIASFASVIGAPAGMMSPCCSLACSIFTGTVKKLLKTIKNKKKKLNKIVVLPRSKLNSIESKISEALINNQISHEDFTTIINEEKRYRELQESIRMINSQRSDVEKISLIKEGKKIGTNEAIKRN